MFTNSGVRVWPGSAGVGRQGFRTNILSALCTTIDAWNIQVNRCAFHVMDCTYFRMNLLPLTHCITRLLYPLCPYIKKFWNMNCFTVIENYRIYSNQYRFSSHENISAWLTGPQSAPLEQYAKVGPICF